MTEAKVKIKNLYKIFGDTPEKVLPQVQGGMTKPELLEKTGHVLGIDNVSLDIPEKQLQVIMGLSGAGKSTLLRHINRLIEPTAGEITVDGRDVLTMNANELRELRRSKMSMVFQKFGLLPHRKVIENVAYGLTIQGLAEDEAEKRAMHWIERVGLSGFEQHYPGELSGGMQQRVGLARALATDADILLMDEPFSALDPLIRTKLQDELLDLQRELKRTIIFVSHDLDEAFKIGNRIAIMEGGRIVQCGTPREIFSQPATEYVADFVANMNPLGVLTARDVMGPGTGKGAVVAADTPIRAVLERLGKDQSPLSVIEDGQIIGSITAESVTARLGT